MAGVHTGGGTMTAAFRAALPVSLPVMAGYLFLGAAYGVLMHQIGYGPGWTFLMSVMVFGGTIQFIATSLLAAGFHPWYAFIVSAMVNARHLFYGFSMLRRFQGTGWKKPLLIFWLTDETFALLCNDDVPENIDPGWFRLFVSMLDYMYWLVGGVLGNLTVRWFTFDAKGIDFVMTALFTVIVVDQWRSVRDHFPALLGLGASVVCLAVFGPQYFIIPAMIIITAGLLTADSRPSGDRRGSPLKSWKGRE